MNVASTLTVDQSNPIVYEAWYMFSREERVQIFMSLFRGREDVFARRWQKWNATVAGYAPVYADEDKESYMPLTTEWIEKHLIGTSTLGIYPLLQDNTSNFIAADFDGDGWQESVRKFLEICEEYRLPVATERSRSGNGAHIWCFFAEPIPAAKSRRVFLALLRQVGCIDPFEKNNSFDRLFPNQDYLSGKGLGNLIVLPLQGESRRSGNTVFVDTARNFEVIADQWQFLHDLKKAPVERFDDIVKTDSVEMTVKSTSRSKTRGKLKRTQSGALVLTLGSSISIPKITLPSPLASFLREELNILNIGYLVKERAGLPTYGEKRFIKTLEQTDDAILVPRGFLKNLYEWLDEHGITYRVVEDRLVLDPVEFGTNYSLFPYQLRAVAMFESAEQGILVAPAGAGKTMMGLDIISQKKQPAIILTHRRQIYDQWLERVEQGFNIPRRKIGQFGSTKKKVLPPITVAMVQTLARMKDMSAITSSFGTVLVDECHHMPSHMFRDVVAKFSARYRFGLTATPSRKYNDAKLIGSYLGEVIHTIDASEVRKMESPTHTESDSVVVRNTHLTMPFGTSTRDFQLISKVLSNDATRNALIARDVAREAQDDKKCLVLTERKEHAEMLRAYLRKNFETVLFSGDLSGHKRTLALQKIKSGRFRILIATGQILGEGADIAGLDVLFLGFPVSFHGKLAQYVGRIRREGGSKKVYDYRDKDVPVLEKLWKKRATFYRKNGFEFEELP